MQNEDMTLINEYTRKELCEDEVYIFTVTLCDNDIDRDFERFTKEALDGLCGLFQGKTGLFDHNMKSEGQSARIFKTWTETVPGKKTADGKEYYRLRAKAYMVRTESNKALIDEIEGGIKKEVSVGCAMGKTVCSICGGDMRNGQCSHIKGKTYDGELCVGVLSEPYDAYEWSFVAVPSQRQAGVTKSFLTNEAEERAVKFLKSADGALSLSKEQAENLSEYIDALEKDKEDAKAFRAVLKDEINKYAAIAMPYVDTKAFLCGISALSAQELCQMRDGLKKQINEKCVPLVQLGGIKETKNRSDNSAYQI
ncbi:MAG: hypothetical protein ACI4W6_00520 [Acutalibacteraceae bacterium]